VPPALSHRKIPVELLADESHSGLSLFAIERYAVREGCIMATITKKELIDRIAESSNSKRVQVKRVVQQFLDEIVNELGKGNRLEFRDFGVFETKLRKARKAQNPKTLEPVAVPEKRTVKFKVGRLMKQRLGEMTGAAIDDEAGDVDEMADTADDNDSDETGAGEASEQASAG
jgi:integration host factor subunit beta